MTRDLRKFARQTNTRLVAGFLALALLGGPALIYLFWGREAAVMGLICVLGALVPAVAVWVALALAGWIARKLGDG